MSEEQMTLFGESEIEWVAKSHNSVFSRWSYSRRNLLDQCPRKYYYEHYGSKQRVALEDPEKETQRFLKMLRNRHLRAGDILHLVISVYLKKLQQGSNGHTIGYYNGLENFFVKILSILNNMSTVLHFQMTFVIQNYFWSFTMNWQMPNLYALK